MASNNRKQKYYAFLPQYFLDVSVNCTFQTLQVMGQIKSQIKFCTSNGIQIHDIYVKIMCIAILSLFAQ